MNEDYKLLYDWAVQNQHLPANVTYDKFAAKVANDAGKKWFYDGIKSAGGTDLDYNNF